MLLWLWRRNIQRSRGNETSPSQASEQPSVQPYLELAQLSARQTKGGAPVGKTVTGLSTPSSGAASTHVTDSEDPSEIVAIQRAVRAAGFSTQALLQSLGRVRAASGPDDQHAPPYRAD
ncbi:hypothetical protein AURDEDRAFT_169907 [Auricularia subglabra TFB-10046 SS5]|uniref:Uncharacterized protein n=1 Tax=Auricularia subglabra (strain TFB-10046 / SS5) TaxID=717982 RepID=J0LJW8_AURST|nr:hypothetical protein AURDEDRAFT_169907 [Auricularia subglabra TFB-10046 SS5]